MRNNTRLRNLFSLVFLVFIIPCSCKTDNKKEITIVWTDKQAKAIAVSRSLLDDHPADSTSILLRVRLKNTGSIWMLGDYSTESDNVIFKPLVPLSSGLEYEVFFRNKQIGKIKIPAADSSLAPVVLMVYPTPDTLPENLLKLYLQFSHAMREGESQQHITLLNRHKDTIPGIFLDLQPELWNKERTVITMWLDPGRIKRGLIPNELKGNPLQKGEQYTLIISRDWKDIEGLPLIQSYTKQFVVGGRDSISPSPGKWVINVPLARTRESLTLDFKEPLDYYLLLETIHIIHENGKPVRGNIQVLKKEKKVAFMPAERWLPGRYKLLVGSYLEDVAGNNLDRPFDRDLLIANVKKDAMIFERSFVINEPGIR